MWRTFAFTYLNFFVLLLVVGKRETTLKKEKDDLWTGVCVPVERMDQEDCEAAKRSDRSWRSGGTSFALSTFPKFEKFPRTISSLAASRSATAPRATMGKKYFSDQHWFPLSHLLSHLTWWQKVVGPINYMLDTVPFTMCCYRFLAIMTSWQQCW